MVSLFSLFDIKQGIILSIKLFGKAHLLKDLSSSKSWLGLWDVRLLPLCTRPLWVEERAKYPWDNCETFSNILILLNTNFPCFFMTSWSWHKYLLVSCESAPNIWLYIRVYLWISPLSLYWMSYLLVVSTCNYFASYQRTILEIRVHSVWRLSHGLYWASFEICSVFLFQPLPDHSLLLLFVPFTFSVLSFSICNIILICNSYMYISKNETLSFPQAWPGIQVNASILGLCVDCTVGLVMLMSASLDQICTVCLVPRCSTFFFSVESYSPVELTNNWVIFKPLDDFQSLYFTRD